MIVTENQLDQWVRGNARDAQGVVVEFVWRLVAASSPRPHERRFPLGDSIEQPGPDGYLNADIPFSPFVHEGKSYWEIGSGLDAGKKATSDYNDLVTNLPEEERHDSTFVFVTPLSGRRDWTGTWKDSAQSDWLDDRRKRGDWRAVDVIDGTRLIDWLSHFPAVELWLAERMGLPIQQLETPEQRWAILQSIGEPPALTADIFLLSRGAACAKIQDLFFGTTSQLKLETHYPDQVVDFVAAAIQNMDEDSRVDAFGRCLIVSGPDAWNAVIALSEPQVLVAAFDLSGSEGTTLLQRALRAHHAVIFGGLPGGVPHPNREPIGNPRIYDLQAALEKAGYSKERARVLAQKSAGDLSTLLRCLHNLSLMPEWAEGTAAADLVVAEILGGWNETLEQDRTVAEGLSGKAYGEWIGNVREVSLRPGTPLRLRDGVWKFTARYEGWFALGPKMFDEHLEQIRRSAVKVLREEDPKFEMPADERFAASVHGKVLSHSSALREGLADTLALLGTHPDALTSASVGKAEATAILAVREILTGASWATWASLNDLLPLLAEAAPTEFLNAIDAALTVDACPFDLLFAEEGSGIRGTTYMSGLLWALESLAWDASLLTRVVVTLGELDARDPGGNWSNRPGNSLATILLPWLPQTNAAADKRLAAVKALLEELPDVGWRLLLRLLPQAHSMSSGSHRPRWREVIADEADKGVTVAQYQEQVEQYSELAIGTAVGDPSKLLEIIARIDDLPPSASGRLLEHLVSDSVASMSSPDRARVWNELVDLVTRHRKFSNAQWALSPEQVEKVAEVAERLAPKEPEFRYQRLFAERDLDLYEEAGNYQEQQNKLTELRRDAVESIAKRGRQAVLAFSETVESPWRVGLAYGAFADNDSDPEILPSMLDTENVSLAQVCAGYVRSKFVAAGWPWVDQLTKEAWSRTQVGQFLAYLPFTAETWQRSSSLLGADESPYWHRTTANPYEAAEGLEFAVDRLIDYERPNLAIRCLFAMTLDKKQVDGDRAIRALLAVAASPEGPRTANVHEIQSLIEALQSSPKADADGLLEVEWVYLALLTRPNGASPVSLERRLATDSSFFCEVIRLVFRARTDSPPEETEAPSEEDRNKATNAYQLLSGWRIMPGTVSDSGFDAAAFAAWLDAVKVESKKTGHFEVSMTMVGHVLTYAPADPGGLWINRAVAGALNAKDADDMRDGFRTQLFNSRGVHGFTGGDAELGIAATYRSQAEAVEAAGFHRLATTLRELAESYKRDAERESKRDPYED